VTREGPVLGPLGRRLFAAFLVVALSSVAVLTAAALVGADRGLSAARQADRQRTAERCAAAAAAAYEAAGGWPGADLRQARAIADGAGARLLVLDENGSMATGAGNGPGNGTGNGTGGPGMGGSGMGGPGMEGHGRSGGGTGAGPGWVSAPVNVGSHTAGTVRLGYGTSPAGAARGIAWTWIAVAALAALVVAVAASVFVTRRLAGPVRGITRTARAIAAGDRTARSGVRAPGELGELARAFDGMADEVDRAERARRHMAADVAHELRTPLTALRAGLEELRDGLAEPAPARLAALHDQALRLGRIVDDLGELAAAESAAPSLHIGQVDLGDLARTALRDRGPELRAAGLAVHADLAAGVAVRGDAGRLHQALGNLLANAARYCRPGDSVTVTVRADHGPAQRKGTAVVEVADTGPGIPAGDLPHVFDRFWRGGTGGGGTGTLIAGSGIGLAVVRELVTAHGGTVHASSAPAGGATFTVRLPLHAPHSEPG
jgi:two-component system sensor histidine kinase BaeS